MPLPENFQKYIAGWVLFAWLVSGPVVPDDATEFSRDVLPILATHCFECHGPDGEKREGDLRLDQLAEVIRSSPGKTIINPAKPQLSLLVQRISADDENRMPPPGLHAKLPERDIQTIVDWVKDGAKQSRHWAFLKPQRPALPRVQLTQWAQNPVDLFVLNRLEKRGLLPSEQANRFSLLKRLYLDLTGLIPSPEAVLAIQQESFVDWPKVIDSLLASPEFGELKARGWLDAARFADTMGHAADKPRSMWLYRDWVIDAFNDNMPFDQFTIEQLAGDLLPDPGQRQLIATGFHRNSIQALGNNPRKEEFRVKGIVDRLDTTGKTWLGLTISCAECHDHKYDPISQKEYYELFAIFNNVPHYGAKFDVHGPRIKVLDRLTRLKVESLEQRVAEINRETAIDSGLQASFLASLQNLGSNPGELTQLQKPLFAFPYGQSGFLGPYGKGFQQRVSRQVGVEWTNGGFPSGQPGLSFAGTHPLLLADRQQPRIEGGFSLSMWVQTRQAVADLLSNYDWKSKRRSLVLGIGSEGEPDTRPGHLFLWLSQKNDPFEGVVVESSRPINDGQWHHVVVTFQPGQSVKFYLDSVEDTKAALKGPVPRSLADSNLPLLLGGGYSANPESSHFIFKGKISGLKLFDRSLSNHQLGLLSPGEIELVERESRLRPAQYSSEFKKLRLELQSSLLGPGERKVKLVKQLSDLKKQTVMAQVMAELDRPRQTYVHRRGNFENRGEPVTASIPAVFGAGNGRKPAGEIPDRLGLARQIVGPANPLTARVIVNRIWQHHFGQGLVRTPEDFGVRGDYPSHPLLLDWLAVEFVESGWDVKKMHRLILNSATYQQSSRASQELIRTDPENRYLARASRYRLSGEQIRDVALKASGVLVKTIGGPSVFPPQPQGIGQFRDETAGKWINAKGQKQYRKSIYTFWQRMSPYPALVLFDSPSRERCIVKRSITNTPLQSLVTLNDPHFADIARKLGSRIENSSPQPRQRIENGFLWVLARFPTQQETMWFESFVEQDDRNAWFQVAQVLLNLDEALSRE